jgi:hypothetical protein
MPRRRDEWCAVSEQGRLKVLVNDAAYQVTREGIGQIQDGEWDPTFRANVYCPQSDPLRIRRRWPEFHGNATNYFSMIAYSLRILATSE